MIAISAICAIGSETTEQIKPAQATNQAALDRQKRAAYKMMTDRMAAIRRQVAAAGRVILGNVSQKTSLGLMIFSGQTPVNHPGFGGRDSRLVASRFPRGTEFYGHCLLLDHPKFKGLVDEDYVEVVAYPCGDYSYQSVGAGGKTIRRFTADFNKAYSGALKEAGFNAAPSR